MSRQAAERAERVEAWLANGGIVLAATERARRSLVTAYGAAQRAHGLLAWQTPSIFSWDLWVREQWLARNREGLLLLNTVQEQALWARTIASKSTGSGMAQGLLQADRLASTAMQAHRLLADYAPTALRASSRIGWGDEAAIFSRWLTQFETTCRSDGLISPCRLALQLSSLLGKEENPQGTDSPRPKLLLIGFDRLVETQRSLLDAWGQWAHDAPELPAAEAISAASPTAYGIFWSARDEAAELEACVEWLHSRRQADPDAQLLVITTGLKQRRGALERALLRSSATAPIDFEFSLGVPLSSIGIARAALLILRWLAQPIAEAELDWLLTSGYAATDSSEELALAETMLAIRRSGAERPEWPLSSFLASLPQTAESWSARLAATRDRLRLSPPRQSPLEWATLTGLLLETAGWPGFRPLGSAAFQAQQSFAKVVEACGSLGFDGSAMEWAAFVNALQSAAAATIFATESTDSAILITEPLESAGLLADGIWFLGADEQSWPGRGQPHPFLPAGLQRDAAMPHSSNQADWQLSRQATQRLLASTEETVFSFARHSGETEARPSRLAVQALGAPQDLLPPENMTAEPLTQWFEDTSRPAFLNERMAGGSATLSRQSNCPFQAFATARLNTQDREPAEAGLSARQRGQLLHGVLVRIWGGNTLQDTPAPGAIRTHAELTAIPDLAAFVRGFVDLTMHESFQPGHHSSMPDRFPPRLLALEADRLTRLVAEWLAYEQRRLPFSVDGTEIERSVTVAGLTVKLRLDRVDSVAGATGPDSAKLIIDYKTGTDGPKAWEGDRPDNVQLPLYATHAVPQPVEGLVFARVKAGDVGFYGRVRNAATSVQAGLTARATLVRVPLTGEQLEDWRLRIEQLGKDFVAGRAEVDPKDGLKTCERCYLHAVCRIYENQSAPTLDEEETTEAEEAVDA